MSPLLQTQPPAFSGARLRRSTDQSIASATPTAVSFDTVVYDTAGLANLVAHPTRLTFPAGGHWLVGACCTFAANATGTRTANIVVNGANDVVALGGGGVVVTAADFPILTGSTVWLFAAGDFVELQVNQNSGGNLACPAFNPNTPVLWAVFLG